MLVSIFVNRLFSKRYHSLPVMGLMPQFLTETIII